ncbi:hypothetical protein M9H77_08753 [Catharanthus roseus]|uniref:Uncharacterized protein n=1 Tax=Catharanthus roseus TaxID=4058 RepID=A0ACC0BZ42_CATRO|nr:hypothetical protein M9H77_08753 [Catharanthus roseus]
MAAQKLNKKTYNIYRQRIALHVASPPYEGLFRWRRRFRLGRVDTLEEEHRPQRLFGNRVLLWCLAGIDYEMPELGSDDLVMGFGLCPWSLTVALHVLLNLGVEAALMCLDSLRPPSCTRNPHKSLQHTHDPSTRSAFSVRGLHCTWLVPRTRASSDGVDVSDSGEWIYLKRSIDRGGCGPIGLHAHRIILCGGVRLPSGESGGARH